MPNTTHQPERVCLNVYDQSVDCGIDTEYEKERRRVAALLKMPHPGIRTRHR